jgi:hypothetical protein
MVGTGSWHKGCVMKVVPRPASNATPPKRHRPRRAHARGGAAPWAPGAPVAAAGHQESAPPGASPAPWSAAPAGAVPLQSLQRAGPLQLLSAEEQAQQQLLWQQHQQRQRLQLQGRDSAQPQDRSPLRQEGAGEAAPAGPLGRLAAWGSGDARQGADDARAGCRRAAATAAEGPAAEALAAEAPLAAAEWGAAAVAPASAGAGAPPEEGQPHQRRGAAGAAGAAARRRRQEDEDEDYVPGVDTDDEEDPPSKLRACGGGRGGRAGGGGRGGRRAPGAARGGVGLMGPRGGGGGGLPFGMGDAAFGGLGFCLDSGLLPEAWADAGQGAALRAWQAAAWERQAAGLQQAAWVPRDVSALMAGGWCAGAGPGQLSAGAALPMPGWQLPASQQQQQLWTVSGAAGGVRAVPLAMAQAAAQAAQAAGPAFEPLAAYELPNLQPAPGPAARLPDGGLLHWAAAGQQGGTPPQPEGPPLARQLFQAAPVCEQG